MTTIQSYLNKFPFIAITRKIATHEADDYLRVMLECGFTIIETPLNSPSPYDTIEKMAKAADGKALIGAGTVTDIKEVDQVYNAGGNVIVSPNCDLEVISRAKELGLFALPGVATPTEAFAALKAGADGLKLFPFEIISLKGMKAMQAIIPSEVPLIPVGGIGLDNWQPIFDAGAAGFGLGSSLYRPGIPLSEFETRARGLKTAWDEYKKK